MGTVREGGLLVTFISKIMSTMLNVNIETGLLKNLEPLVLLIYYLAIETLFKQPSLFYKYHISILFIDK